MRKLFLSLFLAIALTACYQVSPGPDFDMAKVITPDSMISLLTDMHMVDGIISSRKDKKIPTGHLAGEYFDVILKKHNIDRQIFEESMRYYAYHTEEFNDIYEKVITNLSLIESSTIRPKEPDSLAQ